MSRIILASASPRRRELLTQIGIEFEVVPSECEETAISTDPADIVEELSLMKAADVLNHLADTEDVLVIGADTVVAVDTQILGKPANNSEAYKMLHKLQGKTHSVYTGVTLISLRSGKELVHTFVEETQVTVSPMRDSEIQSYLAAGESLDKAGAYGIQGTFAKFVSGITGDYNNVVGLPLAHLYQSMKMFL